MSISITPIKALLASGEKLFLHRVQVGLWHMQGPAVGTECIHVVGWLKASSELEKWLTLILLGQMVAFYVF